MKDFNGELRIAYMEKLQGIQLNGVVIPVVDEELVDEPATIPITAHNYVKAYIIIKNQTRSGNSVKNGIDSVATIQVDIVTIFDGRNYHSAGKTWSERIANEMLARLWDFELFTIRRFGVNGEFNLHTTEMDEQPLPVQVTQSSKVFRKLFMFTHDIEELRNPLHRVGTVNAMPAPADKPYILETDPNDWK